MTISYSDRFWKLFFRWKGSLWKTVYKELSVYLMVYYAINLVYRFLLHDMTKKKFEAVAMLFDSYCKQIPLTFLLGFYVGMVCKRWWEQFSYVSWPDSLMYWVSAYIKGNSEDAKTIRKACARYCVLTAVLAWRSISLRVKKRFPTEQHVVDCGLMTEEEFKIYSKHEVLRDPHKRWFIPLNWVQTIFVKCAEQNRLTHPNELKTLLDELRRYRQGFMKLFIYDWISIPLIYTQVTSIVTYAYFTLLLFSRQTTEKVRVPGTDGVEVELYVPVFTILQFLFYVGWLKFKLLFRKMPASTDTSCFTPLFHAIKVGEDLMSPFGEDDEDFEFNYLLDRHLEIAFLIVDTLHGEVPPLYPESNTFSRNAANKSFGNLLPHTIASLKIINHPPISHCVQEFTGPEMEFASPKVVAGKTEADGSTAVFIPQLNGGLLTKSRSVKYNEKDSGSRPSTPFRYPDESANFPTNRSSRPPSPTY